MQGCGFLVRNCAATHCFDFVAPELLVTPHPSCAVARGGGWLAQDHSVWSRPKDTYDRRLDRARCVRSSEA
jgi:hypothetical protein